MKRLIFLLTFLTAAVLSYGQSINLNDVVRANTLSPARTANALDAMIPYTATGTDTYAVTILSGVLYSGSATYTTGDKFTIVFTNANTGTTPTLNINGEGAIAIKDNDGTDPSIGAISGALVLRYNGTNFLVVGASGGGDVVSGSADSTWLDVKDFFPDGVTLATSTEQQRVDAWQAAIEAAQDGSYGIKFAGIWDLPTDSLVVTEPISITGIGYGSALTTSDNSGTVLLINAPVPRVYYNVIFPEVKPFYAENFIVKYVGASTPTSTSRGIKVEVDTSISFLHKFVNIKVDSFYVGMQFHNVANAEITGSYFRNNRAYGFLNTNGESLDYGKLMMHHNVFTTVGPLTGEPDSTSHVKIEGGAGFDISFNDFYGYTDYAVWIYQRNTTEYFPATVSSEYHFKDNKVLFVNDYAFLFMSNYGSGSPGTKGRTLTGNRIQNVQLQGNNTGFNGLVKTVGGVGSMYDFQISENFNEFVNPGAYVTPVVLDGAAMTNVTVNDNYFIRQAISSGGTSDKPIVVTGSISGYVNAFGNSYAGYNGVPDIQGFVSHNFGIGKVPTVTFDAVGSTNTYGRFSRLNNSYDVGTVYTPLGTINNTNPQFFTGQPAGQAYYSIQRNDGSTQLDIVRVGGNGVAELEVRKDQATTTIPTTTSLQITNANATGIGALAFSIDGTAANRAAGIQYNNTTASRNLFVTSYLDYPVYFGTNSAIRMTVGAGAYAGRVGIGTTTPSEALHVTGNTAIGGNATAAGTLKLLEDTDDGTNYTTFKVGAQSGNIDYTLPTVAPTVNGYALTATTAGVMSWASVNSTLTTETTQVGNVGTGEDNLFSYTIPAATLATNGNSIRARFSGTFTANGNAKTLKVKYGGTTIVSTAGAYTFPWIVECEITRTGATTQKCNCTVTGSDTGIVHSTYFTAAETLSGTVALVVTGEATADNDIVKETAKVKFEN